MPKARSQFYGRKRYYAAAAAAMPAWLAGQPTNTYIDAGAGSRFSLVQTYTEPSNVSHSGIFGYCGATYIGNTLYVAGNGGHLDGAANGAHSCNAAADSPAWNTLRDPTATVRQNFSHYADGRPSSRHTHDGIIGIDDRIFLIAGYANYGNGNFATDDVDAFNLGTNDWDVAGTWPPTPGTAAGNAASPVCRDTDGNVYVWSLLGSCPLYKRTKASGGTWSEISTGHSIIYTSPMAYDPGRNRLIMVDGANSKRVNLADNSVNSITWTGAQAAVMQRGASLFYVDALDAMLFKPFGVSTFYRVNLDTFEVTTYAVAGTAPAEAGSGDAVRNLSGRVGYLKNLKLVYIVTQTTTNLHGILIP